MCIHINVTITISQTFNPPSPSVHRQGQPISTPLFAGFNLPGTASSIIQAIFNPTTRAMSRGNDGGRRRFDLRLNHPRAPRMVADDFQPVDSPRYSTSSSCLSSEEWGDQQMSSTGSSSDAKPMVLVGCQRCLMYVMLAHNESKCPKCKSSALLEIGGDGESRITNKRSNKSR